MILHQDYFNSMGIESESDWNIIDQIRSNLMKLDQIRINLIKLDQIGLNLIKLVQVG